jgi:hypothetical protein
MMFAFRAVHIEFFLQEGVHCHVQGERRTVGTSNAKTAVEVETARTLDEQFDFTSAQFKRISCIGIKDISCANSVRCHVRRVHPEKLARKPKLVCFVKNSA